MTLTGAAGGFASLFAVRLGLGFGEGAAFPTATRAMAIWTPVGRWGFAQGITQLVQPHRKRANAGPGSRAACVRILARFIRHPGVDDLGLACGVVLVFPE